jgi:transcriptional regulator with XRE-family HTH domain
MTSDAFELGAFRAASAHRQRPGRHSYSVDVHFGKRLRQCRLLAGLNQVELGKAVGLTHQQVQKYECAASRVRVSRLWDFSVALKCPMSFFFEGIDGSSIGRGMHLNSAEGSDTVEDRQQRCSWKRETLELARAYRSIKQGSARRTILRLVQDLGTESGNQGD